MVGLALFFLLNLFLAFVTTPKPGLPPLNLWLAGAAFVAFVVVGLYRLVNK